MTSVVANSVVVSQSTWADNGGMTWNSVRAGVMTWATSRVVNHTVTVTEDTLSVGEVLSNRMLKQFDDAFGIVDARKSNFIKNVLVDLNVSEVFGRTVHFKLAMYEGLAVAEALVKSMTISKAEALTVYDQYLRRSNAVISDMLTDVGDITLDNLIETANYGHAPGYAAFRDFIPGDYEFQKALFRVVLMSSTVDRARLNALRADVDVPDVFDRGTGFITVAATGLYVAFARPFHIVPDITLTLKGGTVVAIPDVISSDELGFTAILVNPTSGARVTGSFTWAAHGY